MMRKDEIQEICRSIESGIARKEALLRERPEDEKLRARLEYDRRILEAGRELARLVMPSGRGQAMMLTPDEREFLAIYNNLS